MIVLGFFARDAASAASLSEPEYDDRTKETSSEAVSEVEITFYIVFKVLPEHFGTLPHVTA